jgi:hypothetical protein
MGRGYWPSSAFFALLFLDTEEMRYAMHMLCGLIRNVGGVEGYTGLRLKFFEEAV